MTFSHDIASPRLDCKPINSYFLLLFNWYYTTEELYVSHQISHGLFHFFPLCFSAYLKTDSSKSLSTCNLIMEETPDSGLAEEIQRYETDIGAFTWGLHARTDSVSQEMTPSESREDIACLSEAE